MSKKQMSNKGREKFSKFFKSKWMKIFFVENLESWKKT